MKTWPGQQGAVIRSCTFGLASCFALSSWDHKLGLSPREGLGPGKVVLKMELYVALFGH